MAAMIWVNIVALWHQAVTWTNVKLLKITYLNESHIYRVCVCMWEGGQWVEYFGNDQWTMNWVSWLLFTSDHPNSCWLIVDSSLSNIHKYNLDRNTKYVSTLHWRHSEYDDISNHQPHGCLLNRVFRRRSKKTPKLRATDLCARNSPGSMNSPHKGPVTRKMFPFDDVIMIQCILKCRLKVRSLCSSISVLYESSR